MLSRNSKFNLNCSHYLDDLTDVGVASSVESGSRPLEPILIVSAPGDGGQFGGVFAVRDDDRELLDPLPTTGVAISPDSIRLARLTWVEGQNDISELVGSDSSGLLSYRRSDSAFEAHSLLRLGDELHAVSIGSNCVAVLDDAG